jgi:hypothetical protein
MSPLFKRRAKWQHQRLDLPVVPSKFLLPPFGPADWVLVGTLLDSVLDVAKRMKDDQDPMHSMIEALAPPMLGLGSEGDAWPEAVAGAIVPAAVAGVATQLGEHSAGASRSGDFELHFWFVREQMTDALLAGLPGWENLIWFVSDAMFHISHTNTASVPAIVAIGESHRANLMVPRRGNTGGDVATSED